MPRVVPYGCDKVFDTEIKNGNVGLLDRIKLLFVSHRVSTRFGNLVESTQVGYTQETVVRLKDSISVRDVVLGDTTA